MRDKKCGYSLNIGKVFIIVYDITQYCNLTCIHCAVNAKFVKNSEDKNLKFLMIKLQR